MTLASVADTYLVLVWLYSFIYFSSKNNEGSFQCKCLFSVFWASSSFWCILTKWESVCMVPRLIFAHTMANTRFSSAGLGLCRFLWFTSLPSHFVLVNVASQTWDLLQTGICAHMPIAKYSLLKTAVRSSLCLVGVLHLSACGAWLN